MKTNTLDFDAQALRERILDLAMRGKLVPQDPNNEPASTLLKSCDLKSANEQPHVIPRSWEWIVLGSAVKFINGRAYKKAELLEDKSLTPVLRVGNLFTNSSWYYSDLQLDPDKYIDNGDLIYAWSASFGPRIWDGGHVIYHYHIWKLVLDQVVDKNYLYYFLLDKRNVIGETDLHGSTMKHITKTNMEHLSFPLPPLIEQQRIAAKIAQLFALLRKVESSTQQYAELQTLLKTKVLDLAMRGKLVKQDPNDESASVLLEKIKTEKAELVKEKKIKKSEPFPPITDEEKPFDIPDSWEWARLGDVAKKITDGTHNPPPNSHSGKQLISAINIKNGKIDFKLSNRFVTDSQFEKEDKRTHIRKGDVLLTIVGSLGNAAIVENDKLFTAQRSVAIISSDLLSKYLYYSLTSKMFQEQIFNNAKGTTQRGIYLKKLSGLILPLPPINEQCRIVNKINELYWLI